MKHNEEMKERNPALGMPTGAKFPPPTSICEASKLLGFLGQTIQG